MPTAVPGACVHDGPHFVLSAQALRVAPSARLVVGADPSFQILLKSKQPLLGCVLGPANAALAAPEMLPFCQKMNVLAWFA